MLQCSWLSLASASISPQTLESDKTGDFFLPIRLCFSFSGKKAERRCVAHTFLLSLSLLPSLRGLLHHQLVSFSLCLTRMCAVERICHVPAPWQLGQCKTWDRYSQEVPKENTIIIFIILTAHRSDKINFS